MSGIVERLAQAQQFTPKNTAEYIALQFAKRLKDETAIFRYVQYVAHHSVEQLMRFFYQAQKTDSPAREFHSLLAPPEE